MLRVGDVAAMPLPLGGYGACQVSGVSGDCATVCALDWHSDELPTLDDLASAAPLILDHHGWSGRPDALMVDSSDPPPPDFVWLGQQPVHPDTPPETNTLGAWESIPRSVAFQRRWDLHVPAAAKAAYRDATHGPVMVDLGDVPRTMYATASSLTLPAHLADVRWPALDALPQLTTVRCSGPDRGLAEALTARPIIQSLVWDDPPHTVDLSTTHLTTLTISGTGPRLLRLPPELIDLHVEGEPPAAVEAAGEGRWIHLSIAAFPGVAPNGLHGVRRLDLRGSGDLSLTALAALTDLEWLHIRWNHPHGGLLDGSRLSGFSRLHTLRLADAYGVDASSLSHPPTSVRRLDVNGIRRSQSELLMARHRGTPVRVTVWGAKSDAWLASNIDNPLRDWVDDDEQAGAAACEAYASALRAIDHLPAGDPATATRAQPILRHLIEQLNTIEERSEIIDTLRREEAADAFFDLAQRAGVTDSEAADWFDEWRDF
ncbi:hypothetical protein E1286_31640 [Nonomuraea terrae]|uniref:Leucine-rich repeat domain-containing protein n=1 Tax=Nonomuraea terrae TaxID=2530383 RepID=A0A4R4YDS7_9ACTN|nr:hypothetical protein [Nonomuraea terrae]TDD42064.1 hypothetical protein E1286_31640 [Nonomuraea terrae]